MVFAVVIHTLPSTSSKPVCMLYSQTFAWPEAEVSVRPNDRRSRKTELASISQRINSEIHNQIRFRNFPNIDVHTEEDMGHTGPLEMNFQGIFTHSRSDCSDTQNGATFVVIYRSLLYCSIAFICHQDENITLAEMTLASLIGYLEDSAQIFSQPQAAIAKSEIVMNVINTFLPDGLLIFANHRVLRQLEKTLSLD